MVRLFVCSCGRQYSAIVLSAVLASALVLAGCSRDEQISTYEEPAAATDSPASGAATETATQAPEVPERLVYETPQGWQPGPVGGMRKAAFVIERDGKKVEITAIDLIARASALLPNVNRWRGQIQLGAMTQEQMEESIEEIEVAGVKGHYVELFGPENDGQQQAILGVVVSRGGRAWFFKLFGDAELAKEEKERFKNFVTSVKFTATAGPEGAPAGAAAAAKAGASMPASKKGATKPPARPSALLKYTAPDEWTSEQVSGMRKAAFRIVDGKKAAEVTVIDLSVAAGGLLPNINRWRGQIELADVTQQQLDSQLQTIQVDGQEGQYVELMGPQDVERPLAILGVVVLNSDRSWFFKMIGDTELVTREKDRFEQFVKSVTFRVDGE